MLNTNAYKNMSSQDLHYFKKYIKYKQKYIQKKKMLRGGGTSSSRDGLSRDGPSIRAAEFNPGELEEYNVREKIPELEGNFYDKIHGTKVIIDEEGNNDYIKVYLIPIFYRGEVDVYVSLWEDNIKNEWEEITKIEIIESKDLYIRNYGSNSPQVQYYNYNCRKNAKNCIRHDVKTIYDILKKIQEEDYFKKKNIKTEDIKDLEKDIDKEDLEKYLKDIKEDYVTYGKGLLNIDKLENAATLVGLIPEKIEVEEEIKVDDDEDYDKDPYYDPNPPTGT